MIKLKKKQIQLVKDDNLLSHFFQKKRCSLGEIRLTLINCMIF